MTSPARLTVLKWLIWTREAWQEFARLGLIPWLLRSSRRHLSCLRSSSLPTESCFGCCSGKSLHLKENVVIPFAIKVHFKLGYISHCFSDRSLHHQQTQFTPFNKKFDVNEPNRFVKLAVILSHIQAQRVMTVPHLMPETALQCNAQIPLKLQFKQLLSSNQEYTKLGWGSKRSQIFFYIGDLLTKNCVSKMTFRSLALHRHLPITFRRWRFDR